MPTLVYSPAIRINISTSRHGVVDVSGDVSSGNLNLRTARSGGSSFSFQLSNSARKYDGIFTPNDRIVVFMKRIKWLQVFSGYLDAVPFTSVYAESVSISASDTLKRLKYALYDPGSEEVSHLLRESTFLGDSQVKESTDSNMGERLVSVLTELGGWDRSKVHMGAIPADWYEKVKALHFSLDEQWNADSMLGSVVAGESPLANGTEFLTTSGGSIDRGAGYGTLPMMRGRATGVEIDSSLRGGNEWYCSMRLPYQTTDSEGNLTSINPSVGRGLTDPQIVIAKSWWNQRKILIVNSANNKSIVVRVVNWGPPEDSKRDIEISPAALAQLGLDDGDYVDVRFAKNGLSLGEATAPEPEKLTSIPGPNGPIQLGPISEIPGPFGPISLEQPVTNALQNLDFTSGRRNGAGDQGNTKAAAEFLRRAFSGKFKSIGGYRSNGSVSTSDHPKGLALDIMVSKLGVDANPEQVGYGNAIALWFLSNAGAFGTRYAIWNNQIYTSSGVRPYKRSDGGEVKTTLGHRDHVHLSFSNTGQTAIGPTGTPLYQGIDLSDFMARAATGGVIHQDKATSIVQIDGTTIGSTKQLFTTWNWQLDGNADAIMFTGARIYMNDRPVTQLVDSMMAATMRDYCSAPNGDILAWFPDYFNLHGNLARMVVQTIELKDFQIIWSDRGLVTHQFVTGNPWSGYGAAGASADIANRRWETHGIASVDYPEMLETLLNVDPTDPSSQGWTDAGAILQRFGVRVASEEIPWAASPAAEFWTAIHKFRMAWASQFSSSIPIAFMPELFPGMILQIPEFGFQVYTDGVTHSFSVGENGTGFSTSALVIAPSTIGNQKGLYGLPRGGQWVGSDSQGTTYGPNVDFSDYEGLTN